jgi:phospholipase/carboxylesterase
MPQTLDGPRLAPRGGPPRQLVVFLHGYGADGNDLIAIGREWQRLLPDAAFVAPHAPEPCLAGGAGRQWFPLTFRDPHERWRGVNRAAPALHAFLDAELARHGLPASRLALVGFSQGTMMALHAGLRREAAPAAIVGFSGLLVLEEGAGPESLRAGPDPVRAVPPILLAHGDRDDVIPVDALFLSADALAAAEVPVEWHLSAGVGHGIDGEALRHAALFLARALATPPDPR